MKKLFMLATLFALLAICSGALLLLEHSPHPGTEPARGELAAGLGDAALGNDHRTGSNLLSAILSVHRVRRLPSEPSPAAPTSFQEDISTVLPPTPALGLLIIAVLLLPFMGRIEFH